MTATVDTPRVVLASGSPRRRELLDLLTIRHRVHPADVDETPHPGEPPRNYAVRLAVSKATHVARFTASPVLAADTVVAVDRTILGKPGDAAEAGAMLRRLSGRTHVVHTAMALVSNGGCRDLVDSANVRFRDLSDDEIEWYVATGEPSDKAGAYAVQGAGGLFVASVEGAPSTVIGLPMHRLPELFLACGLSLSSFRMGS